MINSAKLLLRLGDLAGHGIAIATKDIYDKAFGDQMFRSPLTELLLKSGRNGNVICYCVCDFLM